MRLINLVGTLLFVSPSHPTGVQQARDCVQGHPLDAAYR